jgi:hypothetical protein
MVVPGGICRPGWRRPPDARPVAWPIRPTLNTSRLKYTDADFEAFLDDVGNPAHQLEHRSLNTGTSLPALPGATA